VDPSQPSPFFATLATAAATATQVSPPRTTQVANDGLCSSRVWLFPICFFFFFSCCCSVDLDSPVLSRFKGRRYVKFHSFTSLGRRFFSASLICLHYSSSRSSRSSRKVLQKVGDGMARTVSRRWGWNFEVVISNNCRFTFHAHARCCDGGLDITRTSTQSHRLQPHIRDLN
jgi:hypothetical protein